MKISAEWLKDSAGALSYARVVGFISITVNLIWRCYMGVDNINSWPSAFAGCCGIICGLGLWGFEVLRENKKISVKVGDKEFGAELGGSKNASK